MICSQYQKLFLLTTEWLTWLLRSSGDVGYGNIYFGIRGYLHKQPESKSFIQLTTLRTSVRESLQPDFKSMILLIKACDSLTVVTKSAQSWLLKVHAFLC